MKHLVTGLLIAAGLVGLAVAPVRAQDPLGRDTPRGTMQGYLHATREGDHQRAMEYLNLQRVPRAERATAGPRLARDLRIILEQTLWIVPETLSDNPVGDREDGLGPALERVGTIRASRRPVDVLLERVPGEDGAPIWKIAAATVAHVPGLAREFGYGPLAELLPSPFFEIRFLEMALWQWVGLLMFPILAAGLSWLVVVGLTGALTPLAARLAPRMHERLLHAAAGPARLVVSLAILTPGLLALHLAVPVREMLAGVVRAAVIVTVAWVLLRVVDLLALVARERLTVAGRPSALSMVPLGTKAVKVLVLALTGLGMLQNLGVNVTGILAGLGIGGLAVALAAQKTVENLFGGVSVVADQPVRIGDFCRFGDKMGIVEEIGLRSTRIRTLGRTVIAIPNAEFATLQIENFARRDKVWLSSRLGLRYETTPDQLRWILVEIRKLLYSHTRVEPDAARIRFVGFGAYSLDLDIFAYVRTTDFGEFLAIREDLYLRIMDIVAASGTGFAFPSQTTYLGRDTGLDPVRSQKVEAEVQAWREQNALYLPEFPPDKIAALNATLAYPPDGAGVAPRS